MDLKKRQKYSIPFKLRIIHQYSLTLNYTKISSKYKIGRNMIRSWVPNKANLLSLVRSRTRYRVSSGSRCNFPALEQELNETINKLRRDGVALSGTKITSQARMIADRTNTPFPGSRMWLYGFLGRESRQTKYKQNIFLVNFLIDKITCLI